MNAPVVKPALRVVEGLALARGPDRSPNCKSCPFAKDGQPMRPVRGIGPKRPRWVAVGMEPGQMELTRGEPFVGPSGELFNRVLGEIDVPRGDVWITNLALCWRPGASDSEKALAYVACRPRLEKELRERAPDVPVLTLGKEPAQAFLGSTFSITQLAGSLHSIDVDRTGLKRDLITTLHPAQLLHALEEGGAGLSYYNLLYDVAKVERLARGDAVRFTDDLDVEAVDPLRAEALIFKVCELAEKAGSITVDFETKVKPGVELYDEIGRCIDAGNALRPHQAQVTAIGIGTPDYAVSVRWQILTPKAKARIRTVFADRRITKTGHNLRLYDRPVARRHNIPMFGPTEDTLHLHHAAFPGTPHDLQAVLFQFWCASPWKAEHRENSDSEILKAADERCGDLRAQIAKLDDVHARSWGRVQQPKLGNGMRFVPSRPAYALAHTALALGAIGAAIHAALELFIYNAKDVLASARLVKPLRAAVAGTKTEACVAHDAIMADIAERAYEIGVPLDFEKNADFEDKYRREIAEAEEKLSGVLDDLQFRELFFKKLAAEQAKQARKDDPGDYLERVRIRHRELTVCQKCLGEGGIRRRVAEGKSVVYECSVCDWTGTEKTLTQKLESRRKHAQKLKRTITDDLWVCPACFAEDKTWTRKKISPVRARTCPHCNDTGIEPFQLNLGADVQLVAYLKAKGVPMYVVTEKGRTSTKKDVLEGIAHVPAVHAIMDYREAKKMLANYILAWRRAASSASDQRMHSRGSIHSRVGRRRYEDPLVQNIPKQRTIEFGGTKKVRPNLRSQVVAPRGKTFLSWDFKTLHPRIIALFSGDAFLRKVFEEDRDLHIEFAKIVWKEWDSLSDEERDTCRDIIKQPEYCTFYDGAVETAWQSVVKHRPYVTLNQVKHMASEMNRCTPGVQAWKQTLFRMVANPPHTLRSAVLERQICFPMGQGSPNDIVNLPVLATEVDIVSIGMTSFWKRKPSGVEMIIDTHDGGVVECHERDAIKVARLLRSSLTQTHTRDGVTVHFPVKISIAKDWAALDAKANVWKGE